MNYEQPFLGDVDRGKNLSDPISIYAYEDPVCGDFVLKML